MFHAINCFVFDLRKLIAANLLDEKKKNAVATHHFMLLSYTTPFLSKSNSQDLGHLLACYASDD
jgi:hypothetical protein